MSVREDDASCRKWHRHYPASSGYVPGKTLDSGVVLRTLRNDKPHTYRANMWLGIRNSYLK